MRRAQATFDIDANIRRIAATQLGLITVDQATNCGVDKHALARRRDSGALIPVFRHVMRLAPFAATPPQRTLAAALAVPGAIIAGTSAALIHDFPLPVRRGTGDAVVLSVVTNRPIHVRGVTVVRQITPPPSRKWLTTRLATPASTLLLLPRFVDADLVERCLDHCLVHRLASAKSISTLITTTPTRAVHRRQLLLDLLAERSNGMGHRSNNEQDVGRWLKRAGLTGWARNHKVRVGDDDVEVDFGWPGIRAALEVSPFFTHGSKAAQKRDAERRRLLAGVHWHVIEAVDDDIAHERAFARTVAALRSLGAT